jgi:hypothetical protein
MVCTAYANVGGFVLRVKVMIDEIVSSDLPVAEMEMPASYKL